jgi:serine/threonine-protein kinase 24/25/MST4
MAERNYDDTNDALDPELLYTKEYCIGWDSVAVMVGGCSLTLST